MSHLGETLQAGVHSLQKFLKQQLARENNRLFFARNIGTAARQSARFTEILQPSVGTSGSGNVEFPTTEDRAPLALHTL